MEERKRDVHKIHHTLHVVTNKVLAGVTIAQDKKEEYRADDAKVKDEDLFDEDAELLEPSQCINYVNNQEVKRLEADYFQLLGLDSSLYFGGKLGSGSGIQCACISTNGRLVAYALQNGHILVYDTDGFRITRFFTGLKANYKKIELSRDNNSQVILTDDTGNVYSFLMKGQV